jgi:hypothetical protein
MLIYKDQAIEKREENRRMNTRTRRLLFIGGVLLLLLLLVSALPQLTVAPRRLLQVEDPSRDPMLNIVKFVKVLVLLALPLYVVFLLLFIPVLRSRKALIAAIVLLLILLTAVWLLAKLPVADEPRHTPQSSESMEGEVVVEPLPETTPASEPIPVPTPPQWVSLLVSFIAVSVIILFVAAILWWFWPRRMKPSPLLELSHEVEQALEALEQGEELRNVVVRCYVEMGHVVNRMRGIKRARTMTPREFEQQLAQFDLPPEPIAELTRLFERVRYGTDDVDAAAEHQARECLSAIMHVCREDA